MREFWVRIVSLVAVIGILVGYNQVLEVRAKNEELVELQNYIANKEYLEEEETSEENSAFADGSYQGEAEGFGGPVTVEVTIKNGAIESIEVISAEFEDEAYLSMAKQVITEMVSTQSTEVDVVSGATFSSNAIINATIEAIEKAAK